MPRCASAARIEEEDRWTEQGADLPAKYAQIGRDSCPPRRVLAHFDDPTHPRSTIAPCRRAVENSRGNRREPTRRRVGSHPPLSAHCYDRCCVVFWSASPWPSACVAAVSDEPGGSATIRVTAQRWRRAVGWAPVAELAHGGADREQRARRCPRRQEGRGIGVPTVLARGRPRRRPVARGARRGLCRRPGRAFRVPGNVSGGFVAHRARVGFERVRDRGRARTQPVDGAALRLEQLPRSPRLFVRGFLWRRSARRLSRRRGAPRLRAAEVTFERAARVSDAMYFGSASARAPTRSSTTRRRPVAPTCARSRTARPRSSRCRSSSRSRRSLPATASRRRASAAMAARGRSTAGYAHHFDFVAPSQRYRRAATACDVARF